MFVLLHQSSYADDFGMSYVDLDKDSALFLNPDLVTWPNNQVEWMYKTNNRIDSNLLVSYVDSAINTIERHANVNFTNIGTTSLDLVTQFDSARRGTVLIEVLNSSEMNSYVFDLTNGDVTDGGIFSGYAWIWWQDSILSGQIALNIDWLSSATCWKGIITHELGHILNLGHSDQQESIMFASPYNSCEFQQTLRYDDIKALHQMYPEDEPNYEAVVMENGCLYLPNIEYQGVNYQVKEICIFDVEPGSIIVNTN